MQNYFYIVSLYIKSYEKHINKLVNFFDVTNYNNARRIDTTFLTKQYKLNKPDQKLALTFLRISVGTYSMYISFCKGKSSVFVFKTSTVCNYKDSFVQTNTDCLKGNSCNKPMWLWLRKLLSSFYWKLQRKKRKKPMACFKPFEEKAGSN